MKEKELKELKLTKNIIIPFPNFQQNTIISPTQMNDNFEEIEHAYNTLIDNHNGALEKINKVLSDLTSSDNEAIVNEQERVKAEETRVQNEEERVANEEERKTEETKRIAMYNVHLNDEIRREQKHIQMVGEFDTKVGEVDTLISTKTEEYNSFVETKTEEYNTFVETKEVEIQDAINSIPPKSELIGEKGDKGDKGEKGDKGDRGEQGLQGIQGIQGLQGVKGDKGDKGEQGIQGLKGDKGDKGDRGEQGVKGDTPSITHLETSINNKIQEVETRFNALTSSQQQDAEVIDARDGEVSLKARLDRDIEKAKQVYVNVEGSHISTDSSSGYLKDVEILGNTIQDASNLADIRSVGDKVEGQELYEIPVLSNNSSIIVTNIHKDNVCISHTINDFTSSFELMNRGSFDVTVLIHKGEDWQRDVIAKPNKITKIELKDGERVYRIYFYKHSGWDLTKDYNFDSIVQANTKLEEDKLTILSPTPLEKVGDVRDRIIEKDGVFGVEKNVGSFKLENLTTDGFNFNWNNAEEKLNITGTFAKTAFEKFSQNHEYGEVPTLSTLTPFCKRKTLWEADIEGVVFNDNVTHSLQISINKTRLKEKTAQGFIDAIEGLIIYHKAKTPQFIPLPHDQQVKLRTFANKTNISFGCEIEGTIKAQVPKSLGATVNTHTEQINNLNKELDRVKKLEENTVSTVETESDFTTVEATSNGYFEDVKLEGKTLVNLARLDNLYVNHAEISDNVITLTQKDVDQNIAFRSSNIPFDSNDKTYTIFVNVLSNTCDGASSGIVSLNPSGLGKGDYALNYTGTTLQPKATGLFTIKAMSRSVTSDILFHACLRKSSTDTPIGSIKFQVMILEGDHTQNPPSYFEGLKSVGDGTDEIVVSSVNENLFDGALTYGYTLDDMGSNVVNSDRFYTDLIEVKYGITYSVPTGCVAFAKYTENKKPLGNSMGSTLTIPYDCKYIRIIGSVGANHDKNIMLTINSQTTEYTPHKSDKKRLLFYNNETQTWEKPILREWDSIEKHSNGKYYYHQRSVEVVLNGSENWGLNAGWSGEEMSTNSYYLTTDDQKTAGLMAKSKGATNIISEVMPTVFINNTSFDSDCVSGENHTGAIYIRINKSKVSNGIKPYLQQNPMRVVYQLAQEKVYECTNIDLITYANETNYVVNSGAIVPKTTLKVHNNISNVVNILQEKVSLLENKFIQGLKNVLAGDMYSLAELLYPEDFVSKEEPIDVPTLLI